MSALLILAIVTAWLLAVGVIVMFFMSIKELERRATEPDIDRERVGIDNTEAWSA